MQVFPTTFAVEKARARNYMVLESPDLKHDPEKWEPVFGRSCNQEAKA
jgi:hypothetical protein